MNQDHSLDGVDEDNPENQQRRREYRPVSWQARRLCEDLRELESMSEADKNRYAAPLPTSNFIKR